MKRIYYFYDEGNQPIVTIGIFKDEKGFSFARTLSIYGEGETLPLNKGQARNIVDSRFENAASILDRSTYTNEIYPRRVKNLFCRLTSIKNKNRCVNDLFGNAKNSILKIDLNAEPTDFEKYLLRTDVNADVNPAMAAKPAII